MEPEEGLSVSRTADGFVLQIPALLTLERPSETAYALLLENLTASFGFRNEQEVVKLGDARCTSQLRSDCREQPIQLSWEWSLTALATYEALREGRVPGFDVTIAGNLRHVLPGDPGREPISVAHPVYEHGQLTYSRDLWVRMLRDLNIRDAVVVEIPFTSDPPTAWEGVWSALEDARNAYDQGGTAGWKACIANVRHALEEWRSIEQEDQGPGWQRPPTGDLHDRTKVQRAENLRWHLLQFAHLAPHSKARDWDRDDALLALSTLTALLASRKP